MPGRVILRHTKPGEGEGTEKRLQLLKHREYTSMITVDCDGQHTVADIAKLRAVMDSAGTHAFILLPGIPPAL